MAPGRSVTPGFFICAVEAPAYVATAPRPRITRLRLFTSTPRVICVIFVILVMFTKFYYFCFTNNKINRIFVAAIYYDYGNNSYNHTTGNSHGG